MYRILVGRHLRSGLVVAAAVVGVVWNGEIASGATAASRPVAGYVVADSLPGAEIRLLYDGSIPDTARAYIEDLARQVLPVLTEILGPPLASQTLTVSLNPPIGAFAYSLVPAALYVSRLPTTQLEASNPVNLDFNANFVHELVHAYQAQYAYILPAWFREGFAQAATDLAKNVLRERGADLLQHMTASEESALRTYDSMSRVGAEVLTHLYGRPGRFLSYANSEGMWWLLLLSQSTRRDGFSYASLDYFRGIQARIPRIAAAAGDAPWHGLIASASRYPIDGMSASEWVGRQPAARTAPARTVLGFYPADCLCPGATSSVAQHLIIVFQTDGVSRNGAPIRVLIRDERGDVVSDETVPFRDFGFGFFRYTIPKLVEKLPKGRYDISVEATVDGAPIRAENAMVVGIASRMAAEGMGVFDAREIQPGGVDSLKITSRSLRYAPVSAAAGFLLPSGDARAGDVRFRPRGKRSDAVVFFPIPYTRFLRVPDGE